jgi:hydrogenase maturation protein HypF
VTATAIRQRVVTRVEGVVQGVGFRPYVFRLAEEHGLAGFVRNDTRGVVVEVEGPPAAVARFLAALPAQAPPLARVERVSARDVAPAGETGFEIRDSDGEGPARALVSPDTRPATACLAELLDPGDRRFATRSSTARTAAAASRSCAASPTTGRSRRWPASRCARRAGRVRRPARPPLPRPAERLPGVRAAHPAGRGRRGSPLRPRGRPPARPAIVAVKGIGGYHLACRADDEAAVARCARASTATTSRSR